MTPEFHSAMFNGLQFMVSGLVLELLGRGDWMDFTRPITNVHMRMALIFISRVMLMYGFLVLSSLVIGIGWAGFLIFTIVGYWILYGDRTL